MEGTTQSFFDRRTIGKIPLDVNVFLLDYFSSGQHPRHRVPGHGTLFFFTKFGYIFAIEKSSF